ncbi:hypothetical protein SERLA73DRAFT_179149 [Serpula lacrymans var. lacrymans S7.3]|uniref:Uncharacterized protein n=2 Tax=Serpula lacrymans var. lacrymans TaxID=341189 RepID=F8PTU6_SERL3|nr:uncharacterized protein SERLADRAFT_464142 [Serpula lacrymans var. lacrymans S7.9]EGO01091.1 hypothetical protein SERLA73DRAFT_179149 [Serpula lacrymans var. lacrymans S7.3]EGO26748.1 hypothetical protein SERLADRAFT_464142 [Serpula lacrymans var. lacrymans S7.9]
MRRHIPKEQKILVYKLSCIHGLSDRHVSHYLGISQQTIRRIRKTFRDTGEVGHQLACQGQSCALDGLEFLEGCIERQPDMILSEFLDSIFFLWRALHRIVYTNFFKDLGYHTYHTSHTRY